MPPRAGGVTQPLCVCNCEQVEDLAADGAVCPPSSSGTTEALGARRDEADLRRMEDWVYWLDASGGSGKTKQLVVLVPAPP